MYSSYRYKLNGAIVAFLALITICIQRVSGLVVLSSLKSDQSITVFEFLLLFGLVVMIFGKEKENDELTQSIKLKSFKFSFVITNAMLLGMGLGCAVRGRIIGYSEIFFIAAISILSYLISYHLWLYRNDQKIKGALPYLIVSIGFMLSIIGLMIL